MRRSKKELLDILRKILRKHGSLSRKIIDDEPGAPPTATYQYHFGGILPAYERIGYGLQRRKNRSLKDRTKSLSNTQLLDLLRKLQRRRGRLSARLIDETKGLPAVTTFHARFVNLSRAYRLIGYVPKRTTSKRQAKPTSQAKRGLGTVRNVGGHRATSRTGSAERSGSMSI